MFSQPKVWCAFTLAAPMKTNAGDQQGTGQTIHVPCSNKQLVMDTAEKFAKQSRCPVVVFEAVAVIQPKDTPIEVVLLK